METFFDYMKTNKDSLVNIIYNKNKILYNKKNNIIQDAVFRTNKIVTHTYNFLKLYILYLYGIGKELPIIDEHFVKIIMRVVSLRKNNRGGKSNKDTLATMKELTKFYNDFYGKTVDENDVVYDDKLSYILAYEAQNIVTNINTNIKEHFVDHVYKLINVQFNWKQKMANINNNKQLNLQQKKIQRALLYQEFNKIKSDVLNITDNNLSSMKKYHKWIKEVKKKIIPHKKEFKISINYDVCASPQDYLESMIFINKQLEQLSTENNPVKLFNVLPLRTRIVPSYITLDTSSLVSLFIEENKQKYYDNIKKYHEILWMMFFSTHKRVFQKNGYYFNYMIKTDGVGCSILFHKVDEDDEPIKMTGNQLRAMETLKEKQDKQYIEKQDDIEGLLSEKNYVCIDPGLSDLIYCMDVIQKTTFRYTQAQRNHEIRNKRYREIVEEINKETIIKIDNEHQRIIKKLNPNSTIGTKKHVKQLESELSHFNSKTCDFHEFMNYLKVKNLINYYLFKQYAKRIFRKLKWNRFMNRQRSESNMLNKFEDTFGYPEFTDVIMGDYDNGGTHLKGKEPCVTKRIRKLLKTRGYNVYLINEFRTSMLCNKCDHKVTRFHYRKIKGSDKEVLVWGLVRCTNENCKPHINKQQSDKKYGTTIYNRDANAVVNMIDIVKELIATGKRPKAFTRSSHY